MGGDNFELVDNARKLLGLAEETTIEEIKKAYKRKMNKYHPDKNSENNDAHWQAIEIIKGYEVLVKYCQNYKFSFKQDDYSAQDSLIFSENSDSAYADWWKNHYGNDAVWGNGSDVDE